MFVFVEFFEGEIVGICDNEVTDVVAVNEADHDEVAGLVAFGVVGEVHLCFEVFVDAVFADVDLVLGAGDVGHEFSKVSVVTSVGPAVDFVFAFEKHGLFFDAKDLLFVRLH